MPFAFEFETYDVTVGGRTRTERSQVEPVLRRLEVSRAGATVEFAFDGAKAQVTVDFMQANYDLLVDGNPSEWSAFSSSRSIGPLARVLKRIHSTPCYHLFLSSMQICGLVEAFAVGVEDEWPINQFQSLVGRLEWGGARRGAIYVLPLSLVPSRDVVGELLKNGKLFKALSRSRSAASGKDVDHFHGEKFYVPYATPIGFHTKVDEEVEFAWRRISSIL